MRICDITNFYHEKSGGVKTYLHRKIDYIARYRCDEHLVIVPGPVDSVKREGRSVICRVGSPELPFARPYRLMVNLWRVNRLVEQFRPDLVEVGCPYFLPWAIAARRKAGFKLVGFYHSDFPRAYVRTTSRIIGEIPAAVLERGAFAYVRAMYRRMDLTLAPSLAAASTLALHGVKGVQVLPLGVDLEHFHPRRRTQRLRLRLGISPERILLLYVGRFAREKGLDVLQQAFAHLARQYPGRFHLLLVGEGDLGGVLREWAAERDDATVWGYLQGKELAEVYASADLFVTAGRAETFGLTILEAQASGLAVVAVATGAAPEAVAPGTGRLVVPGDPAAMAGAIAALAGQNLRTLGLQARRHMEVGYGWENTFNRLFAHYMKLLGCRSREREAALSSGATGRRIAGA
ncbi:MAG: glycosyltransferase [Thermoanaerobacteraceae bacterium]|nr:glycosyltransferase [Thermoanaerobacteraceae bacterium]